ncbi:MAG: metal ABC transporter permease [Planctomycetota bacterium]|jgi:zinc transport system permease protein|nr:metal ABC transporter permease [Planctomycetota bacterium]
MPDFTFLADFMGSLLPFECLQPRFMRQALLGLLLLAPVTAVTGVHVINLHMAFFADAVSHSIFAGVSLGMMLALDPQWSTVGLAILVSVGVTACQRRVSLSADSVIGVFFAGVTAFGLAAASRERAVARNAQSFLWGDILTLGQGEIALLLLALVAVFIFQFMGYNRLLYLGLDPVVAEAHGVKIRAYQYAFAVLLALTSVLAVWTVGVFLVSALLILPAAAARNLSRSAGGMFWWALAIGCSASVVGLIVSAQKWAGTATGPTVVLSAALFFILSIPLSGLRNTATGAHLEKA